MWPRGTAVKAGDMSQSKFRASLRPRDGGMPPPSTRTRTRGRNRLWPPASVLVAVILLHAAVIHMLWRRPHQMPPRVAVPLSVALAAAGQPRAAQKPPALRQLTTPTEQGQRTATDPQVPTPSLTATPSPSETPRALSTDARAATVSKAESAATESPRFDADYLDNPPPDYPALSRRLGEQGRVVLRVYVTPHGRASEVHIERSSGHARLDRAATDTVGRWRFVPAARNAEPVGAWVLVPISFVLKQG